MYAIQCFPQFLGRIHLGLMCSSQREQFIDPVIPVTYHL
jgi:hypothetical protein